MEYISLLFPPEKSVQNDKSSFDIDEQIIRDLELDKIFREIAPSDRIYLELMPFLNKISSDKDIINYRLDVFEDLYTNENLFDVFSRLLLDIDTLSVKRSITADNGIMLYNIASRLGELQSYINCIDSLDRAFQEKKTKIRSSAFTKLKELVARAKSDDLFPILKENLPEIFKRFRGIKSLSVGINVDKNMIPYEATLLSVNTEKYTGKSAGVLKNLFREKLSDNEGIAQLHFVPKKTIIVNGAQAVIDPEIGGHAVDPVLVPLFRDINEVLKKTLSPVYKSLKKYNSVNITFLANLGSEIRFFLNSVSMIKKLEKAGLPVCRPVITDPENRILEAEESYNINLSLNLINNVNDKKIADNIIRNRIVLNDSGRIIILTGPNRGGKTTWLQAAGHLQIMAQIGLFTAAEKVLISPVKSFFTHFPIEEKIEKGTGRLGDEAQRFSEIFSSVNKYSMCLFNESLSSTNATESYYIARDIIKVLMITGTKTIFATHLHELAAAVDDMNNEEGVKEKAVSMVSRVIEKKDGIERTFKIEPGPPIGQSYAREIARKYGISYEQLIRNLNE